ncbi:S1 family peptidase [Streptomyces sp. NBC_00344]|uniref:S1 family peptidase n=1 Tax=Streptomyces sp. NBC_00344 TaxID=2975720 RepID=UPI002E1BDF55
MEGAREHLNKLVDQQGWRLRLRDELPGREPGKLLGAGVLLGTDLVLTCAHVIPGATARVRVEFPLLGGHLKGEWRSAAVVPGHWVERYGNDEGDLALLRLTAPAPVASPVVFDRDPVPYGTEVTIDGFPKDRSGGLWVDAVLKGPGGHGDEWVQINPVDFHEQDAGGFSGAGVTEARTGRLLGIMVAVYDAQTAGHPFFHFYMIPGATVAGHLRLVAERHTKGLPVIPEGLLVAPGTARTGRPLGLQRILTRWLHGEGGTWDIETVFVREDDREAAVALRTTLSLADRERSPGLSTAGTRLSDDGTVPRPGSIGLAVPAAGMTHEELAQALDPQPPRPLSSIAVFAPDRAAAAPEQVGELLRRLADRGARLLLVLHGPQPELTGNLLPPGRTLEWLARLGERADRLSETERSIRDLHRRLAPRVTPLPVPPTARGADAQLWTVQLAAEQRQDGPDILQKLSQAEQAVEELLLRAARIERGLRNTLDAVLRLRGLLGVAQARLGAHRRDEHPEAVRHYSAAQRLLTEGPSDLAETERAVEAFLRTVHRILDDGPGTGGTRAAGDACAEDADR